MTRTQDEIRAVLDGVDFAESVCAILAARDRPRSARQQEIEAAIVAFNPSANEAWEIFEALKTAMRYRYDGQGEDACAKAEPFEAALLQLEEPRQYARAGQTGHGMLQGSVHAATGAYESVPGNPRGRWGMTYALILLILVGLAFSAGWFARG